MAINLKIIFLTFLILANNKGFAQTKNKVTEVIVIGTIHFPTTYINSDTIYNAIQKVQPDIILMEAGSSNFNKDGSFKNTFDENEWNACIKYIKMYPKTSFKPFDIEGRNEIRKTLGINGNNPFFDYVDLQDSLKKLSQHDKLILNRFRLLNLLCDTICDGSLKTINTIATDNILHERQFYIYHRFMEIANKMDTLKNIRLNNDSSISLFEYNKRWSNFELRRNFEMTENILRYISKYSGKKIVVLVGFYHRYSIVETLKLYQSKYNFRIKEYYE